MAGLHIFQKVREVVAVLDDLVVGVLDLDGLIYKAIVGNSRVEDYFS